MRKWLMAAALVVATAGGAAADGQKLVISKDVAASFESYRSWLTSVGHGSFAVTEDGLGGAGAGCPSAVCYAPSTARTKAIAACEKANTGRHCLPFADDRTAIVDYTIAP